MITGEPGLGKSTTIRHWVKDLNPNLYKVIYIPHSTVSVHEFYKELCNELGLEEYHSKRKNLNIIQSEIKRLWYEKKIYLRDSARDECGNASFAVFVRRR